MGGQRGNRGKEEANLHRDQDHTGSRKLLLDLLQHGLALLEGVIVPISNDNIVFTEFTEDVAHKLALYTDKLMTRSRKKQKETTQEQEMHRPCHCLIHPDTPSQNSKPEPAH